MCKDQEWELIPRLTANDDADWRIRRLERACGWLASNGVAIAIESLHDYKGRLFCRLRDGTSPNVAAIVIRELLEFWQHPQGDCTSEVVFNNLPFSVNEPPPKYTPLSARKRLDAPRSPRDHESN